MAHRLASGSRVHPSTIAWFGIGAVIGAFCWTAASLLEPVVFGTRPYDATVFDVFRLLGWTLIIGGAVGVPATLGDRYGRIGRVGLGVATSGMVLIAGLYVRAVAVLVSAGFQAVPATGENTLVLIAAYGGHSLVVVGAGLLGIALWRGPDRPAITAVLLVSAAVLPVGMLLPVDVLPAVLRTPLLRPNNLLVPFGVAWAALGVLVHRRAGRRD
ncbi:hypothetical protein SAMN04488067_10671 [Halorubrum xinjiangense]|uniref:DUF4386 family protein n=1 Tax=Halorubrum xinjiangense TaxID=261291 RepID=A0A1G7MHE6_9EURY|nr:hypothetical protein [Halorubrum xinjiangense]SDF61161.1 hypothetical protein SAMN04488067_10671 [Halorubrum xinjiangense]